MPGRVRRCSLATLLKLSLLEGFDVREAVDHAAAELAERGAGRVEGLHPTPEIEHQILLEVLGVHAGHGMLTGEATGRRADVLEHAGVDPVVPIEMLHGISPSIEDGLAARSMGTGEISLEGCGSAAHEISAAGESQRNHGDRGEEKSAGGGIRAGENSPAASFGEVPQPSLTLLRGAFVTDDEG